MKEMEAKAELSAAVRAEQEAKQELARIRQRKVGQVAGSGRIPSPSDNLGTGVIDEVIAAEDKVGKATKRVQEAREAYNRSRGK